MFIAYIWEQPKHVKKNKNTNQNQVLSENSRCAVFAVFQVCLVWQYFFSFYQTCAAFFFCFGASMFILVPYPGVNSEALCTGTMTQVFLWLVQSLFWTCSASNRETTGGPISWLSIQFLKTKCQVSAAATIFFFIISWHNQRKVFCFTQK